MSIVYPFQRQSFQLLSFLSACIVYGVYGSPTPDSFGIAEIIILVFLGLSIGLHDIRAFPFLALIYGLIIPAITGLINGNPFPNMVRDIIPYIFLFLPIFYGWIAKEKSSLVIVSIMMIGALFSIRTLFAYQTVLFTPSLWGQGAPADLLYLANSPEVLFTALACMGYGFNLLLDKKGKLKAVAALILSIIPILAMSLMMQRAGIGAVVVYITVIYSTLLYLRPKFAMYLSVLLIGVGLLLWPIIEVVFQMLWQKSELVGLNARSQEWGAVITILSEDFSTLLFGIGWGGYFENPAVGGLTVNFTHSLISALLLKTGFLGTVIILAGCLRPVILATQTFLYNRSKIDVFLMGASIFPFMISVLLYASYKSLGFGLILLVFSIYSNRKLEKNDQAVS